MPPATARAEKDSVKSTGRGGRRPGAGRPRGRLSAKTLEIQSAAKGYAAAALKALVDIAENGRSEPARVAAASALLDRGYGKPRQAVEHSGEGGGPLRVTVTHRIVDPLSGDR